MYRCGRRASISGGSGAVKSHRTPTQALVSRLQGELLELEGAKHLSEKERRTALEHMKKEHEESLNQAVAKEAGQTKGAISKLKKLKKEMKAQEGELEAVKRERTEVKQQLANLQQESKREVSRLQGLLEKARLALEHSVEETRAQNSSRQQTPIEEESDQEAPQEEFESLLLDKIEEASTSGNDFWGQVAADITCHLV